MPSQEKVKKVQQIREWFEGPDSVIVLHYKGLRVAEANQFRRMLSNQGVDLRVLKNTLTRIALEGTAREAMVALVEGPVAVAFIDSDAAAAARTVKDFSKGMSGLYFLGGMLGDRLMTADEVDTLATLPRREVMLAMVVGQAAAPLSGFMGVCAGPLRKVMGVMAAIAEKKEAELGPAPLSAAGPAVEEPADESAAGGEAPGGGSDGSSSPNGDGNEQER